MKINYIILKEKFEKKHFTFEQVIRENDIAIYRKYKPKTVNDGYEVIVIGRHNGYTLGGSEIPASETYPGDSQWGISGWTYSTLEKAKEKFDQVKETKALEANPETGERMPKARGRVKMDIQLILPVAEFTIKEVAVQANNNVAVVYTRIKEMIKAGKVKCVGERKGSGRGKATKIYQAIK